MFREDILEYTSKTYQTIPDTPWRDAPDNVVLRHRDDRKWFGLLMYLPRRKLGLTDRPDEFVDVLNIKCEPDLIELLRMAPGIFPAYHMNRQNWISVLLDGTASWEQVLQLLDLSFQLTASDAELERFGLRQPRNWLIPSNPKYYDLVSAFQQEDTIHWKQAAGIRPGDTVFLYVGAPYSAILYRCRVLETDLPYLGKHEHINIRKLMLIHLEQAYDPSWMTFARLADFNVRAVRGPRSMPADLLEEMDRY